MESSKCQVSEKMEKEVWIYGEIEDLISRLETSLITKRGKKHKERADELRIAQGWLTQSKARQNHLKKQKKVKKEAKENQILFMCKEDETNCRQAPGPSPPPYMPLASAPVEQNIPEPVPEPVPEPQPDCQKSKK